MPKSCLLKTSSMLKCDYFLLKVKESIDTQSCPTLCDPIDCSLPNSSIHGIFQARILEWFATSFSRVSSWPRDWIQVFGIAGRLFTIWATREGYSLMTMILIPFPSIMEHGIPITCLPDAKGIFINILTNDC